MKCIKTSRKQYEDMISDSIMFQHGNIYSNGCQKFVMKGAVSDSSDTCAAVLIIIASMVTHINYFMSS